MRAAAASAHVVSGAAHLPARVAARSAAVKAAGQSITALRVEGPELSVRHRVAGLKTLLAGSGYLEGVDCDERDGPAALALWRDIGALALLAAGDTREIWWSSLLPNRTRGDRAYRRRGARGRVVAGSGRRHALAVAPGRHSSRTDTQCVGAGRRAATLWRASAARRAEVSVFQPQPLALAALTRRVKASFDPGWCRSGRMYSDN